MMIRGGLEGGGSKRFVKKGFCTVVSLENESNASRMNQTNNHRKFFS